MCSIKWILHSIVFCLCIHATTNVHASASAVTELQFTRITEGIWVHIGQHLPVDHPQNDDIANIAFIEGGRCVAVIDTGGSVKLGRSVLDAIRVHTDKPICYVINTHIHFDHVLGNKVFVTTGAEFVGHVRLVEEITVNRPFFVENFAANLDIPATEEDIIAPTITVEDTLVLDLGERPLQLLAFPPAHSHSDLAVFDRKTQTLLSGDLIFRERIPVIAGSLKGWLQALQRLRTLPVKMVVPGHGEVAPSMDVAVQELQDYLQQLLEETRAALQAGMFINEASAQVAQDAASRWKSFPGLHESNVRRAYSELEWE